MDFTGGFETKDIIFSKRENGEIESGGFNIDSIFMKLGVSPLHTLINENVSKKLGNKKNSDENVSSLLFSGFAVPIGLLSEKPSCQSKKKQLEDFEEDEFIDYGYDNDEIDYIQDDLYERLLGMQNEVSKQKETNKNKNTNTRKKQMASKKKKQTRKQREKK